MSAKQFYHSVTYPASALPNETWAEIIRWATWVNGFPNAKLLSWNTRSSQDKAIQKALRTSLVTKRYIVRVCRQWYDLALPYSYEYILLGRTKTFKPLLAALKRSETQSDRSLGWWTRHLDVFLRDGIPNPEQFNDLAEIMQRLPNLEIWNVLLTGSIYFRRSLPSDLFQNAKCCGHSLRIVNLYTPILLDSGVWEAFLIQHSNIQYLATNPAEMFPLPPLPNLVCISNPWSYQFDHSLVASQHPNLHIIIIDMTRLPQHEMLRLRDPLDQITHLQLICPIWTFERYTAEFGALRQIFTSLHRLDFTLPAIYADLRFDMCPLAEHIGFRSSSHTVSKWNAVSFFSKAIPSLHKAVPSLNTLQFTDPADLVSMLRVAGKIRGPVAALQDMGIQVVDNGGCELKI